MPFVRYNTKAFFSPITHADNTIFLRLLNYHFHHCSGKYNRSFHMTDRDLASLTGCSLDTVWKAKKRLTNAELISFEIGPKNRTCYTIISPNGKPHK